MMEPEDVIKAKIEDLERRIVEQKAQLNSLLLTKQKYGEPTLKFYGWVPIKAVEQVLGEHGGRMKRGELVDILVQGGLTTGKKRSLANIRISLDLNIKNGRLKGSGAYVSLPKYQLR
ncbi:hypothetical protein [Tunturiibacter lichenicola]|uniref:hypothetical protein n=1 Tax=Tunturiibacter lichenicola TaxID=2051959 RepID=UPI003D9B7B0A